MKTNLIILLTSIAVSSLVIGCKNGDSSSYTNPNNGSVGTNIVYPLSKQDGISSHLFYGEVNPSGLGGLKNITVFDAQNTTNKFVENNDTSAIRYPVVTTALEYNATTQEYANLYIDKVSYVSGSTPYVVDMKKTATNTNPIAVQNSTATNISNPKYTKINYLGSREYLIATNNDTNKTILITPEMDANSAPVEFGDKALLSVTYQSYGASIDGYLVYDNLLGEVQKCDLSMNCNKIDIVNVGSRDFEDDIAGTTYSVFLVDDKLYRVDKKDGTFVEISLGSVKIATGHGTTDLQGGSFYFIGEDYNLYRVDILTQQVIKVTPSADTRLERIRGFTNEYVIFGSDTYLVAAKKDGTTTSPILLAQTTRTQGYKYVTNYGIGDNYLFVRYKINPITRNTTYEACIFNNATPQCRKNSFWAGATIKKEGEFTFESSFSYAPYAYIRVDNTDNFGGGTLKAIDPQHPFDDGISMGSIAKYNFQTFLTNSRYKDETIDSDGGVVFFAKDDTTFHVDAFYFNLLKENSLVQLTQTDPFPEVTTGRDHCHGRHCMLCHNLAGGKIYKDINGTKSAYGYRIRLNFEDGTTLLADIAKGKGENFSIPLKQIKGNFQANVVDVNGTVVNNSVAYYHNGIESANCNYCHARYGATRYGAPGAISITR